MYADHYIPGRRITKGVICEVFKKEVRRVAELRSFMGIWQLFALSNVLMKPINSAYQNCGNPKCEERPALTDSAQATNKQQF